MKLPEFIARRLRPARTRTGAQRAGAWGEQVAADHLRAKGYRILGRNVRFGSRCELDLVARSPAPDTLVFIEVKTRRSETFGRPFAAIGRDKRRAIGRAARRYLQRLKAQPPYIRFDAVEIVGTPGDPDPVVRHIENAFSMGKEYRLPW